MFQYSNQAAQALLHEEFLSFHFYILHLFSCISNNPDSIKIMLVGHSQPCAVFGLHPTAAEILSYMCNPVTNTH